MTNAVDILLIGGLLDMHMVCAKRPVPPSYDMNLDGNEERYSIFVYERDGRKYRLAIPEGSDLPSSEVVNAAIDASKLQPAWDLN